MSQSAEANGSIAPGGPAAPAHVKAARGQPSGLWVLFITEMWERFSYYGMRALLVLYLASKVSGANPGFGWSKGSAQVLFGVFTGLVYLTPLFGGWLADRILGTHRSILIGGWVIAAGQFCLFITEFWGHNATGGVVLLGTAPGPFITFLSGLILIILGTGFFKPCVSVMVGQLYSADDPKRDSGFTIFYMGINVGAFLSGVVAGTLGEKYGWYWGFGSASAGMVLGLTVYQLVRPFYLKGIGLPPHHRLEHDEHHQRTPEQIKQAEMDQFERTRPLTRVDWDRMIVIVVLSCFSIVFWVAFEQAGSSLNLFALNWTDRNVLGFEVPVTWYQSVNPAAIVCLAPLVAFLWAWLAKRSLQPSTPVKFAIGLFILSLSYVAMVLGSLEAGSPRPVALEDTPKAVQAVLQAKLDEIRAEARAEKQATAADPSSESHQAEPKKLFDSLDELTCEGALYYQVAMDTKAATVCELYSSDGQLLRQRADRKRTQENKAATEEKAQHAKTPPREGDARGSEEPPKGEVPLDAVPAPVRATILAQAEGQTGISVTAIVKKKQPAQYVAQWTGKDGPMEIRVAADGFLLAESVKAYAHVGLAGPQWLLLMYLLATCGELCLSPVGLSMVTKLSPARYTSLMMGLYFVTTCIANTTAGMLAAFSDKIAAGSLFTLLGGQADFFLFLCVVPLAISAVVFLLAPLIKRMMHGLN